MKSGFPTSVSDRGRVPCRKALKQLAEYGVANSAALLQGSLVPGIKSGMWNLTGAGLQVFDKRAKAPSDPAK